MTKTKCQHPADNASTETLLLRCPDCGAECSQTQIGEDRLCYDETCPLHARSGLTHESDADCAPQFSEERT